MLQPAVAAALAFATQRPSGRPSRGSRRRARALETALWTGPVGHLLGGALDVAEALLRHLVIAPLRRRRARG